MVDALARLNAALRDRYAIERELGEGGMATVYLAHDLRHDRQVALKVLKPELAAVVGAERFLAEIKTTARLQHPHILPLHDSGEADGFLFYVMPFVEGETLRERLDRERQLPVDEAVRITADVAEALQAAHEGGVIHRDIKPANILLSRGRPLVADFGIALAVTAAGGGRMTETGLSLGTPHYMSPEQATGDQAIGPAADVYALGCVLYEMLAGQPPYTGGTAQAILGKIITGEPPSATAERASVPAHIDAVIRRALEKLPADRFGSAEEFKRTLQDRNFRHGAGAPSEAAGSRSSSVGWRRLALAATAAAAVLSVTTAWGWLRPVATTPAGTPLYSVLLFPNDSGPQGEFALSPDGSRLAFVSDPRLDGGRIWIRLMGDVDGQPRPLAGTEQAGPLAWSPDGTRIAFRAPGRGISVVPADGGTVVPAVEGGGSLPAWTLDNQLLYAQRESIWVASPGGVGSATPLAEWSIEGGLGNKRIVEIPGADAFLLGGGGGYETGAGIYVTDLSTGEPDLLIEEAFQPNYVEGWIVFVRGSEKAAMAQRFDPDALELIGEAVALAQGIPTPGGRAQLSVSDRFMLYKSGEVGEGLMWASTSTEALQPFDPARRPDGWLPVLSHDGSMIASGGWGLWVVPTDGGLPRRLSSAMNRALGPTWSPEGSSILIDGERGLELIDLAADSASLVLPREEGTAIFPAGWGPEGEILYGWTSQLRALDPDGEVRIVQEDVRGAALSPNGQWLAYVSSQGGDESNVFVRAYGGGNDVRVSYGGGRAPAWAPDGETLYFMSIRYQPMAVDLTIDGGRLLPSVPQPLPFDVPVDRIMPHPDGRLLLDVRRGAAENLRLLHDWQSAVGTPGG